MNISDLIKNSLDYYDNQNIKYNKYLPLNSILLNNEKTIINKKDNNISVKINYEVLGVFDYNTKIFIWGWVLPYLNSNETKISRELLNYGLNINPSSSTPDHFYLKSLLVNSRINIDTDFDINLIIALSSYLLKNKFSFIFPDTITKKEDNDYFLTTYYMIKLLKD
jgi:hypothetical protein